MKVLSILKNVVAIILVLSFLFVLTMLLFGFKGYSVVTDSMSPTVKKGYAVFVKKVSFDKLQLGDIVTVRFDKSKNTFTHRVVEIDRQSKTFKTQGDNSNIVDGSSKAENLVGKVAFSVPLLGYISIFASNRMSLAITLFVILTVFFAILIILNKKTGVTQNEQKE